LESEAQRSGGEEIIDHIVVAVICRSKIRAWADTSKGERRKMLLSGCKKSCDLLDIMFLKDNSDESCTSQVSID